MWVKKATKVIKKQYKSLLVLLGVFIIGVGSWITIQAVNENVVLTINGEEVTEAEYRLHMKQEIAYVYNYFYTKHGVEDERGFWSQTYFNEKPMDLLIERTIDRIAKVKIEQMMARDYGIIEDISFSTFLANRDKENARRKKIMEEPENQKDILYGTQYFGEYEYLLKVHGDMLEDLRNELAKKDFRPTKEQIEQRYEERAEVFKIPNELTMKMIVIDEIETDIEEKIKSILSQGRELTGLMGFKTIQEKLAQVGIDYVVRDRISDATTQRMDIQNYNQVMSVARTMNKGEISELIVENYGVGYIFLLEDKIENGYTSLEEAESLLISQMVREELEVYIAKQAELAEIIVEKSLEKIKVR